MTRLTLALDNQEQYGRRNALRIYNPNWTEEDEEDTDSKIVSSHRFTLPCIRLIVSVITTYDMNYTYVMCVASSSISSASLLATSLDTEKCIIMCAYNVYVSHVSFEK